MSAPPSAPPVAAKRPPLNLPFFYGWVIVACTVVVGFLASGMTNLVLGVMMKPMTEDLGWTRSQLGAGIAMGTVLGGIGAPLLGRMADRYGARTLIPPAALIVGALFLILSQITDYWLYMLAYVPGRALAVTVLVGVVPLTAVANWFYLYRPRAMGFVNMALALGGSVMALAAQFILESYGWRTVLVVFGVLTWALVVGPAFLLLRRSPEDVGLYPDGISPEQAAATAARNVGKPPRRNLGTTYDWTLKEAMATRTFWLIIGSFGLATFANGSIGFHQVAYYTDRGLTPILAATALSVYAFSGAVSNVLWGLLAERFSERWLNVGALILSSGCIGFLMTIDTPLAAYVFSVLFGLFARGESALINIILAQYYGRRSFGAISGFTVPFQQTGVGIGPFVAALAYDSMGNYYGVFTVFIGVYLVAALLMFLARRPAPPIPLGHGT